MSFSVPLDTETPQSLWSKQEELGARILLTIPFGSSPKEMQGFVSIMGDRSTDLPALTLCVEKPTGGAIVSTVVFSSNSHYLEFVSLIQSDALVNFFDDHSN